MSRYQETAKNDWVHIIGHLTTVSLQVEKAIENAVDALILRNKELAYITILGDNPINRALEEINHLCYAFIARHIPRAADLRRISSILRFNVELERIGDYAVTICREIAQISRPLEENMILNVEQLAEESRCILTQSTTAFREDDVALAKKTMKQTRQAKGHFEQIFQELSNTGNREVWSLQDLFGLLAIFNALGRICDQSKNICEETVFIVTGETKQRQPVRVLFLEEECAGQSMMAACIARDLYPRSGEYTCAIKAQVGSPDPQIIKLLDRYELDWQTWQPKTTAMLPALDDFNVIVCLQGHADSYLPKAPFRTVVLEWDTGPVQTAMSAEHKQVVYEKMYQDLSFRIQHLMKIMRGKVNS